MNHDLRSIDQTELDRMVDGELMEDEQRSLLTRLEEAPGGWRQLALAYVEDQAWKAHLKSDATAPASQPAVRTTEPMLVKGSERSASPSTGLMRVNPGAVPVSAADVNGNETPGRERSRTLAAVAIVAALLAGFLIRDLSGWNPVGGDDLASDSESQLQDGSKAQKDNGDDGFPKLVKPSPQPEDDSMMVADSTPDELDDSVAVPAEYVQFAVSDGRSDQPRFVEVPVRHSNGTGVDAVSSIFDESHSVIPADVRDLLQRAGHRIEEDRSYWPAELPDGRQVLVPVSNVRVRFVGDRIHH